jgi:Right handed beta helix region
MNVNAIYVGQSPAQLRMALAAGMATPSGDLSGRTDTAMIQAALSNNAEVRLLPGATYVVAQNAALQSPTGPLCLNVLSGQRFLMYGATLMLASGSSGTGSIIGNTAPVTDVAVEGGIIDGNSANTTGQIWGATIWSGIDCDLFRIKVRNITGVGLSHRGQTTLSPPYGRNSVKHCRVLNCGFIGIQCAHQTLGLEVTDNFVDTCVDNLIDIEGNLALGLFSNITNIVKGTTTTVTISTGGSINPAIVGNELQFSSVLGMVEINSLIGYVLSTGGSTGAWTFTVNIDSSGFSNYSSSGVVEFSGDGNRQIVSRNVLYNGSGDCGIFIESVSNLTITDNVVDLMTANGATGIVINREMTPARESIITGNRIKNLIKNGVGLKVQSAGKSLIEANTFRNMKHAMWLLNGGTFLSVGKNTHEQITGTVLIRIDGAVNSILWSQFDAQNYLGLRSAAGTPFTASPIDNPVNHSDRAVGARPVATHFLQSGVQAQAAGGFTDLQVEYQDGTAGVLTIDATFAGAYSLFTGGDTQIHPSVVTGAWTVGRYIWIAGTVPTLYLINAAIGGGIYTIRQPMLLTFTGVIPNGATAATLIANFTGTTGNYNVTFDDGLGNYETHLTTLTNGSTAVNWVGGITNGVQVSAKAYTVAIPGNFAANFTAAHACTEYYALYQVEPLLAGGP